MAPDNSLVDVYWGFFSLYMVKILTISNFLSWFHTSPCLTTRCFGRNRNRMLPTLPSGQPSETIICLGTIPPDRLDLIFCFFLLGQRRKVFLLVSHIRLVILIGSISILPLQNSQIWTLSTGKDIMVIQHRIIALKIKITVLYINDTTSPVILIFLSMDSSMRIGSSWAYLIPEHLRSLLRSILPPLLLSIHKMRSLGDCDGLSLIPLGRVILLS